jgi:hypothetical protein
VTILAIDPGTTESGWCLFEDGRVTQSGIRTNEDIVADLDFDRICADELAIEMIASYGMPVGREVFETCVWIGRFIQASHWDFRLIYRRDVKMYLCNSAKAKDANVRQALIDKLGSVGTKKQPGPLYGVKSHAWAAVAVAVTAANVAAPITPAQAARS